MATASSPRAQARVFRAIGLARARRWGQALAQVHRALAEGEGDALVLVASAAIRFVARDYQGALDCLDRAIELDAALFDHIVEDRVRYASSLGWDQEVREILELAMSEQPDEPRWFVHATRCFVRAGALDRALEAASHALELAPGSVGLRMEVATLLADLGRNAQAAHAAQVAAERAPDCGRRHMPSIARIFRRAGAFAEARQHFEQALQQQPGRPDIVLELAELALWHGDVDEALRRVDQASALDPAHPGLFRARGVVQMLAGAPDRAVPLLDAALEAEPSDASTLIWRAEAAHRLGDDAQAHRLLSRATMQADGYLFVAWIVRLLVVAREGGEDEIRPHHVEEFRDAVMEIVPDAHEAFASGRWAPLVEVLETALERMRGNRTTTATFVDASGVLRRVQARSGVRHASRHALQLVRALPPARVIEALDEIVRRHPKASLPICHRGELYLWLGDLERARADLEAALDIHPFTRWAYIGLTGIDILQGDPEAALRTSAHGVRTMGNTEGPAVYAYRGEAYRLLGRCEEARADLEKVVEITPTRIGAWFDLALVYAQTRDTAAFERVWDHLERAAMGLLSDASRELGIPLWVAPDARASCEDRKRVLEHALTMMRGNRSTSCPTYFTREGQLRFVQPYAAHADGPHAQDERTLDRAQALLGGHGALLKRRKPRSNAARARPAQPSTLTPEQIEHYLTHGYVVVHGCFSREVAARWVEDANRRIRTEPERWVKGYDPSDPSRSLRRYDPKDPSTWTWSRINLLGDQEVEIRDFSPRLWGALCDLLGGEHRIATRTLSDYFVVNLRAEVIGAPQPLPGNASWHIDGPSRRTTLKGFDNGAVAVALFSDVLPDSGSTWLAVDSVPHVARLLAEHPEGVDFVECEAAPALTHRCERFEEVTGEVGDVVLLHPFMVHSGSPNPSGRIRWMSNPNIRLATPMRIDRPEPQAHAPVERVVRRALGMQ